MTIFTRGLIMAVAPIAAAALIAGVVAALRATGVGSERRPTDIISYHAKSDGRTLSVSYLGGDADCVRPAGVVIGRESDAEVELEAFVTVVTTRGTRMCLLADRIVTVQVRLRDELGDRRVTDASTHDVLRTTPAHRRGVIATPSRQ